MNTTHDEHPEVNPNTHLRDVIRQHIESNGLTVHAVCSHLTGVHPVTARAWLYGTHETINSRAVSEIMDLVGLEVRPAPKQRRSKRSVL